jgi:hypothetical protein
VADLKLLNNTTLHFAEAAAPSTPDASEVVLYAKTDGLLYSKDDAGAETLVSGGAGGSGTTITFCRKTVNESFSSTSYADSTNMALALSANTTYKFRYVVYYNTNATSVGIKLAVQGPASCTAYVGTLGASSAASTSAAATMVAAVLASGDISTDLVCFDPLTGPGAGSTVVVLEGFIANGANAGNLKLRHASETATATTILANSHGYLIPTA